MGLKSLNVLVNDYCNSKCIMCGMWSNKRLNYLSPNDFKWFFRNNDFSEVEDLSISGGEPFMRKDLIEIIENILPNLPNLKMLFFNTNGTYRERVMDFIEHIAPKVKELYGCISIEGNEEIHNKIRGINCYRATLETLEAVATAKYANVKAVISTTITNQNRDLNTLLFIKNLAEKLGCSYTFRLADISSIYYGNQFFRENFLPEKNLEAIVAFINDYKSEDPFLRVLKQSILTGTVEIMGNREDGIKCRAGEIFAFIDAKGNIRPCIYSRRIIGNVKGKFTSKEIKDLGKYESCPCCTECTIYPMLNYSRG